MKSKRSCKHYLITQKRQCKNNCFGKSKYCHIHSQRSQKGGDPNSTGSYTSPYLLQSSSLAPKPTSVTNSWYHHHAPDYQQFGDYICIKKDFLISAKKLVTDIFN